MLRKLRFRLTLSNALIMVTLLALFVISTYFFMRYEIFGQSEQLMDNIASKVVSRSYNEVFQYDNYKYFFIETDSSGKIVKTSSIPAKEKDHLPRLVQKAVKSKADKGSLIIDDRTFTFIKVHLQREPGGFVLVFANVAREIELLGFLLGALFLAGIVLMALALYGSLFLADRALVPIKKSWQRQRDFVADASHELRTPLAVIQTNLELVMGNPEETVKEQEIWLENIRIELQHIVKLVEDLLFLARVDSEQQILEMRRFQLDRAIYDAAKPIIPVADAQGVKFIIDLSAQVEFYGDENRIKQLVVILLDNALKHTPAGGQVELQLKSNGSTAEIIVSDTGRGIEHEHIDKIFERFYQVDNARSNKATGTGLGLSIADWIVKEHHGSIKVKSDPGQGTTFWVMLKNKV